MTRSKPELNPDDDETTPPAPQKMSAAEITKGVKSEAKRIEDLKAEAAPVPEVLGRCSQVPKPDIQIEESDPWAEEEMIASEAFEDASGRPVLTKCKVSKPHRQDFIRVHPDKNFCRKIHLLKKKVEGKLQPDIYLIQNRLWGALSSMKGVETEVSTMYAYLYVNEQRVPGLWPISMEVGESNDWQRTALICAEAAMKGWLKVVANMDAGANEYVLAQRDLGEPVWPLETYHELLKLAFKDRYITSLDHPIIKQMAGA